MRLITKIDYPETPQGKRSIRCNVYGNIVGYVSGKRFWEFGTGVSAETDAKEWMEGKSLSEVY